MAEIHNYQNEAQIFGDDDFYDIDFYNGTGYETKKILGSTIKAGIIASVPAPNVKTIYSENDNVAGDRTIKGVAGTHFFKMVDFSTFEFSAQNVESECFKIKVPTGDSFTSFVIANSANQNPMFSVENGYVKINDKYRLPLQDGSTGQILSTDGAGLAQWIDAPQTGVISIEGLNGVVDVSGNGIEITTLQQPSQLQLANNEIINVHAWQRPKITYFENEFFIFDYDDTQGFWYMTLKPLPEHLVGWEFIASATVDTTANFPAYFDFMNAVGISYKIFPTTTAKNDRIRFNVSIRPIINFDGPLPKTQTPHFQQECWRTEINAEQNFQVSSVLRRIDFNIKQYDNQ
eukprot:COSAG06_NODE_526_length_14658_cov_21.228038_4_plen_346_part_00